MNVLHTYRKEVQRYNLVSREEELELGSRIRQGDGEARRRMIEANLRLVILIARGYTRRGYDMDDAVQDGNLGLIKAVDNYDPNKGRFSHYAHWWIKLYINRGIIDKSDTIRLPVWLWQYRIRFIKTKNLLFQETGKEPDLELIARAMGIKEKLAERVVGSLNMTETKQLSELSTSPRDGESDESRVLALADYRFSPDRTLLYKAELAEACRELDKFLVQVRKILRIPNKRGPIANTTKNIRIFVFRYCLDENPIYVLKWREYSAIAMRFSVSKQRGEQIVAKAWEKLHENGMPQDEEWLMTMFAMIHHFSEAIGKEAERIIKTHFRPTCFLQIRKPQRGREVGRLCLATP
jgi:RNA polymerase primary sigma factor